MGAISTLAPLGSSMVAPAISQTMKDFDVANQVIGSFSVTIWLLGFTLGPLFLGPLSEMFGRYPVMVGASWFMVAWLLGAALAPSMASLIVMRLFAGIGGSAAMTIAPAVCADMYPIERRARSTATITMAQCLGPTLGPLIGSYVGERLGWRWNYWLLLICSGATSFFMTIFFRESYAPVLLRRKAQRLRKELGRDDLRPLLSKDISRKEMLAQAIMRPTKMLTKSPIVSLICLYVAVVYGCLYLWFTTIPMVYEHAYGWSPQDTGLAYIGIGIGMVISLTFIMKTNDATVVRLTKRNNGVYEPEFRLPAAIYLAGLVPVSLFWYGWSVQRQSHWIVPIIGSTFFGFGMLGIFVPTQQYLVDAFQIYSASAVAAVRTAISIAGTTLPLAGPPLYERLDLGMGNTVLGIITLVLTPIPWLFMRYGKAVREKWPISL
ncbi:hypothetical protein, variant 1 [Verruconis gallopava]|nr:hypothetical protein, variant 1 [Verruconis gallopava]KIV99879.1 hypothetical protein, variant 1 [Verruconis gallopava]